MKGVLGIFTGRLSRRAYVLGWLLPTFALALLLELLPRESFLVERALAQMALAAVVLLADLPLGMARFRDGGMSGWWYLVSGYPLGLRLIIFQVILAVGLVNQQFETIRRSVSPKGGLPEGLVEGLTVVAVIVLATGVSWSLYRLALRAGDTGPNKYGADPLAQPASAG